MRRPRTIVFVAVTIVSAALMGGALVGAVTDSGARPQRLMGGAPPPNPDADARYRPITPCRLVDTRLAVGTLAPKEIRDYTAVTYLGGGSYPVYAEQGGKPDGCGIPREAMAIQVTVTSVSSTGTGFIRVWPVRVPEPNATLMNYDDDYNTSGSGVVPIDTQQIFSTSNFRLRNYGSTTHVVVDVQGYYIRPAWVVVAADGGVVRASRGASVTKEGTGEYRVRFSTDGVSTDARGCSVTASAPADADQTNNAVVTASDSTADPGAVYVSTYSLSSGNLADTSFTLQLEC